jgi:hypothetical protein
LRITIGCGCPLSWNSSWEKEMWLSQRSSFIKWT